jgi:hypothetical protein
VVGGITQEGNVSVTISNIAGYTVANTAPNWSTRSVNVSLPEVAFTGLTADGAANTATATKLTLVFHTDIDGLESSGIALDAGYTGAAKGALSRKATGTYELPLSGITARGQVSVSVTRAGYSISGSPKTVSVYFTPFPKTGDSLKAKFGVIATGTDGVKNTFEALHEFIQGGGLTTNTTKVKLGDWIDLDGGGFSSSNSTMHWDEDLTLNGNPMGRMKRLIVVGINSFQTGKGYPVGGYSYPGTDTPPQHVVFQFQNIPVQRRMNLIGKLGGYKDSEMRAYLTGNFLPGLIAAGVPDGVA